MVGCVASILEVRLGMFISVAGFCSNEQCEMFEVDAAIQVDVRDVPDGWGYFEGDFGTCEHCGFRVDVSFDLQPEDFDDVESWH